MASPQLLEAMRKYQTSLGQRKIDVPEWGVTFYVTPLTLKEQSVMHGWKERSREEQLLIYAKIIVMKARDDQDKRIYTDKDYSLLIDLDYDLVSRVGSEIVAAPEVEELKK